MADVDDQDAGADTVEEAAGFTVPAEEHFRSRRYILHTLDTQRDLAVVAYFHGWVYLLETEKENGRKTVILEAGLPGLTVWYHTDELTGTKCFVADSVRAPEEVREIANLLQGFLVPWTLEELLHDVDEAQGAADRCRALHRAGWGAPRQQDARFTARIINAAADPDPKVRTAAIWAMTHTEWQEFRPTVEDIAQHDRKRSIRKLANSVHDAFTKLRTMDGPQPADGPDLFAGKPAGTLRQLREAAAEHLRGFNLEAEIRASGQG